MLPARKRLEDQALRFREASRSDLLASHPRAVLLSPVEPSAFERLTAEQGGDSMNARPVQKTADKAFLDAVGEDVHEPPHLGGFLPADDNCLVAPRPGLVLPAGQAYNLAGEIGVEVAREPGEVFRVANPE